MIFVDHLSRNIGSKESNEPMYTGLEMKIQDIYLNASKNRCISLAKGNRQRSNFDCSEKYDPERLA